MSPKEIVEQMFHNDAFSQWAKMEVLEVGLGQCTLRMTVSEQMTNGFRIAHGGITYSLADSALAFAANTHGQQAVSVETSISHLKPVHIGDELIATAQERRMGRRSGIFDIEIHNQKDECVALFRGHVFRTETPWKK